MLHIFTLKSRRRYKPKAQQTQRSLEYPCYPPHNDSVFLKKTNMRTTFLFLLILLQGCSTAQQIRLYEGPTIGKNEEVELVLPINFELLSLDGQKVAQFEQTFRSQPLSIKLTPGLHTLVLRYSDIFEIDADNHDILSSGQITFTGAFQAGTQFQVKTPILSTYEQAKRFASMPNVELISDTQTFTGSHVAKQNPLVFKQDDETENVTYPNLKQLKFWWHNASDYEKQSFKAWIMPPNP